MKSIPIIVALGLSAVARSQAQEACATVAAAIPSCAVSGYRYSLVEYFFG